MNKQLLKVIQGALQSEKQLFPLNQSWEFIHQQYNIGRTQGNKLEITAQDKAELLDLVERATGVNLEETAMTDFSTMHREQALSVALNEKLAGQTVKRDRLAIKTLTSKTLEINGESYSLPGFGHLDIALTELSSTIHHCILLIENYRCFDRLQNMQLNLPKHFANPLVLFRGDNTYNENAVRRLLGKLELPVLVMADLDPKGLSIAQSFPSLSGIIAPGITELDALFKDKQKANPQLYSKQFAGCQHALSTSPYPLIRQLWEMMKTHQAGIVQEHWLQVGYDLEVHSLDQLIL